MRLLFSCVDYCGWALTFVRVTVWGGDGGVVTKIGVLERAMRLLFSCVGYCGWALTFVRVTVWGSDGGEVTKVGVLEGL
ncbi:hypothetical protein [Pseudoalteromonas sp. MSK9-3]|uniref:hypothetical protein n=1 Tax=Pseudoalteromonas sp. MSK9-3 TaxID=1897633 RepID=UPI0011C42DC4|nr:hypothetical protein [Pseudoalteromonas sp. MSK9-3]